MNKKKAIEGIIENFNFETVYKVMKFLDWRWQNEPDTPTIGRLMLEAQSMLSETFDVCLERKDSVFRGCGGFTYKAVWDNEIVRLELGFEIEGWDYTLEDEE